MGKKMKVKISPCNYRKLEQAILFFCHNINNKTLGKTKLFKLLYFADSRFYLEYGKTITGDKYVKYKEGPIPSHANQILKKMQKNLMEIDIKKWGDKFKFVFRPKQQPNLSVFSKEEVEILQKVAQKFKYTKREEIVELSHQELPWIAAAYNKYINLDLLQYQELPEMEKEPEDDLLVNSPEFDKIIKEAITRAS